MINDDLNRAVDIHNALEANIYNLRLNWLMQLSDAAQEPAPDRAQYEADIISISQTLVNISTNLATIRTIIETAEVIFNNN